MFELSDKAKGYALGSIAAATYGMNPLFALPLYDSGMDPDSVLFFRYLFAIPMIGVMMKARGRDFRMKARHLPMMILMGLMVAMSSLALFLSYNYMAAGIASTILFVYPIMVALIMALLFKEKLTLQTVVCIVMASSGIALLYKGEEGATLSAVGTMYVFISALSYAIYIVGVNKSFLKSVPTLKVTFYVLIFGITLFIVRLAASGDWSVPDAEHWYLWGNLVALALFPTAISFLCTTRAIHYIGSTPTAILGALEPVTAIIFGVTIFGETMTGRDVSGVILIIVSVTLVIAGGKIASQLVRLRRMFPKRFRRK